MSGVAQFSFLPANEAAAFAEDIRRIVDELAGALRQEQRAYSGEYRPHVDVRETDEAVEILLDAPGIPPGALRVLVRDDVLIVAGEKAPAQSPAGEAFHLVEREFGRFARALRLPGAFDLARTRATLRDGELSIVLPKMPERRGQTHRIPVTGPDDRP